MAGWFVKNARDARWFANEVLGTRATFEPEGERFEQLGIHLSVLEPGQRSTLYHAETYRQEGFLLVEGECTAIVEDEERPVRTWDFVHCPPGTRHVFVNTSDARCVLVMIGDRTADHGIVYPVSEVALRYGAGVTVETDSPQEAYKDLPPSTPTGAPPGF